ncbi:DUF945 family protein [Duganella sp. FT80W]|uniref:DUF945 family protein n=1 Tax=Duganella guangzhouensis TaxID=2666084 RepID=A0A6I2KWC9_9BURK|nr:DUF945 family protein [Duganella guangzhouensis]MRW88704.1 DUF945 family protein [Duganella guangzhouensis]
MKKTLLAVTMTSAVLAMPSYADEPATVPNTEFAQTVAGMVKELKSASAGERNIAKQLEQYSKFQFSPELRPKLKEYFGAEQPFPLERVPSVAKGQINYVGKLAPYNHSLEDGTNFAWTELVANIATDKAGRALNIDATWPSLIVTAKKSVVSVLDMTMNSRQLRGADNVAYGTANFKIGVTTIRSAPDGESESKEVGRIEDIEARSEVTRRGKMAEIAYRSSIKSIVVGGEQIDRTNFAFRLTNIPSKSLADLDKTLRAQQDSKLDQKAQQEVMLKSLADFGKRAAVAGATLVIDDISTSYRGNVAAIKGRIGFQKVKEADFSDMATLAKKLVARFEVRVPVALVRDVSRGFAAKSVDPAAPDAAKQIDAGADAAVSMVVGKAVSGGFAVVEQNELRSTIEIKDGKLVVNGKVIDIAAPLKALSGKIAEQKAKAEAEPEPEQQKP